MQDQGKSPLWAPAGQWDREPVPHHWESPLPNQIYQWTLVWKKRKKKSRVTVEKSNYFCVFNCHKRDFSKFSLLRFLFYCCRLGHLCNRATSNESIVSVLGGISSVLDFTWATALGNTQPLWIHRIKTKSKRKERGFLSAETWKLLLLHFSADSSLEQQKENFNILANVKLPA